MKNLQQKKKFHNNSHLLFDYNLGLPNKIYTGFPTLPGKLRELGKVKLKIDWNVREFHKIDWLAIANRANFMSMFEAECA